MENKHKVSTDALETLGNIIGKDAKRDAIHIAVEPCIAGQELTPGQNVGIENGIAVTVTSKFLGIVDPFIKESVHEGERFWMLVYPRTITSLRHVWSHPEFPEAEVELSDPLAISKQWITNFASKIGTSYIRLMEGADNYVKGGDYLHMGDNEDYIDYYDEMDTFWEHYEIITGKEVNVSGGFFSCSC